MLPLRRSAGDVSGGVKRTGPEFERFDGAHAAQFGISTFKAFVCTKLLGRSRLAPGSGTQQRCGADRHMPTGRIVR